MLAKIYIRATRARDDKYNNNPLQLTSAVIISIIAEYVIRT